MGIAIKRRFKIIKKEPWKKKEAEIFQVPKSKINFNVMDVDTWDHISS